MMNDVLIDSGRVYALRIPTDNPEADGTATWDSTTVVVVELSAGGRRGLGYTYSDISASHLANSLLKEVVLRKSAWAIPAIHLDLERKVRNMGRPGLASTVISALDVALWDLKAKLFDVPLATLLGQVRPQVDAYGSGGFTSYTEEKLLKQLTGWAQEGFRAVKMKIGIGDDTLQRVKSAAEALGAECELYVDANGAYFAKQALHWGNQFAELGVTWFEEPVSSDDLDGLHLLRDRLHTPVRVAAGEYIYTPDGAWRLLEHQAVDVLQADATRCGGVTDFLTMGQAAELYHVPFSAHTAPSLHTTLCCCINSAINVEYFHDHARIEQMIFEGAIRAQAGSLRPDLSRPGLGLSLRTKDAEPYVVFDSTPVSAS
jgi:L-alanine-DL-glutamate epimerase-like enolase superfamily enzyme